MPVRDRSVVPIGGSIVSAASATNAATAWAFDEPESGSGAAVDSAAATGAKADD